MTAAPALAPVTFEVAGLASRIECAYAKPLLWVTELHPAFRSSRDPHLVIHVEYDDDYWTRGLPWIAPDQLHDVPVHASGAAGAVIATAYYRAELSEDRGRAAIRIAGGFGVGGVLRAIYAALLPRRGACLVRARLRAAGDAAVLECGDPDGGVVALVDAGDHVAVEPTPFHAATSPTRRPRARLDAIAGAGETRAAVAARIFEELVVVDHAPETLERALDLVSRAACAVPALTDARG